ncbi:hypothetical protein JXC34_02535 [Candidatus Woesearchaeota archaeon]|nr:hypothetical protein [Candidatus Woesearchaeota archaeon]
MITRLMLVGIGVLAAALTYTLSLDYKMGPVKASALPSLVVGIFFYVFHSYFPQAISGNAPLIFIGASFVGMSSENRIPNILWAGFAGLVFSFFYLNASKMFAGFGGGLGTTACVSVVLTIGILKIADRLPFKHIKPEI